MKITLLFSMLLISGLLFADEGVKTRAFIIDQVKTSSIEGIPGNTKRALKDFDFKKDNFKVKLKMRLKDPKAVKIEDAGDVIYKIAVELTPGGKTYKLDDINVTTGNLSFPTKEIFTPTGSEKQPRGDLTFITTGNAPEATVSYLIVIIKPVWVTVGPGDGADLDKNISWIVGDQKDFLPKKSSEESILLYDKNPKLIGKCQGTISVDYAGSILISGTNSEKLTGVKIFWAYKLEPFNIKDPLTGK